MADISEKAAQVYFTRIAFTEEVIDYVEQHMGFTLLTFRGDSPKELERRLRMMRMEIDGALKSLEETYG